MMLECGEGLGKDSQADLLVAWLKERDYDVILTKEPGGTPEAEKIRKILLDKNNTLDPLTELFLYEASRRDLSKKVIAPALEKGKIIVSKRGFPSTHAYQGFAGELDIQLVKYFNDIATRGVSPDVIYIIDGDPEVGLAQEKDPDRFAEKGLPYHQKVRKGYLDFAEKYPDISVIIPYQHGNAEAMQEQIRQDLEQRLNI